VLNKDRHTAKVNNKQDQPRLVSGIAVRVLWYCGNYYYYCFIVTFFGHYNYFWSRCSDSCKAILVYVVIREIMQLIVILFVITAIKGLLKNKS
jgi:hypothetical protein